MALTSYCHITGAKLDDGGIVLCAQEIPHTIPLATLAGENSFTYSEAKLPRCVDVVGNQLGAFSRRLASQLRSHGTAEPADATDAAQSLRLPIAGLERRLVETLASTTIRYDSPAGLMRRLRAVGSLEGDLILRLHEALEWLVNNRLDVSYRREVGEQSAARHLMLRYQRACEERLHRLWRLRCDEWAEEWTLQLHEHMENEAIEGFDRVRTAAAARVPSRLMRSVQGKFSDRLYAMHTALLDTFALHRSQLPGYLEAEAMLRGPMASRLDTGLAELQLLRAQLETADRASLKQTVGQWIHRLEGSLWEQLEMGLQLASGGAFDDEAAMFEGQRPGYEVSAAELLPSTPHVHIHPPLPAATPHSNRRPLHNPPRLKRAKGVHHPPSHASSPSSSLPCFLPSSLRHFCRPR